MTDNKVDIEKVFLDLDEIYLVEDFGAYQMVNTCFQTGKNQQKINKIDYIRVIVDFNNKDKEITLKKENIKKIYSFLRIKYNNKNMDILINNDKNYQPQMVMDKINSRRTMKGFIKIQLNIKEFPLKNYILEETNEIIPDYTKIFLLKLKGQNQNTNSNPNPNPLYDNRKTTIINSSNSINNLIETKVITNNNNSTNIYNNSISNNNGINNYNNFQSNQPNIFQNFNNRNNNFNNYNNINLNPNTSPNLCLNQLQNNFNQSNNYNQNQSMNCNGMNLLNNNQNQSFNINNNFTGSNNMNQNFNNSLNQNSMNQNSFNMNSLNSLNQNSFNMNSLNQNSFNMNPMSINSMNQNSMSMNFMNMNNNSYPMSNQIFQTMPNVNNNMLLNPMNNMNMNFNLNSSTPNNNLQNNNQNIQNQNDGDIPDFQLLFNDLESDELFPYVGLRNVGLTCYMNSTLQCLLHIPELNNFFLKVYANQIDNFDTINKAAETGGKLSKGYLDLLMSVITENRETRSSKAVTPNCFHNIIGNLNPQFRTYDANDSKDLLLFLIQSMHEELNYYGNKKLNVVPPCDQTIAQKALDFFLEVNNELNLSIFSYLFYGIFKSETECLVCHQKFYNFQYFQILSFPLYEFKSKKHFNLYQGFKNFIKTEHMRGDNQCFCQKCQKLTDSDVRTKIYYTPPYLIINLDYGKNKKYNPGEINFGISLDLTGFTDEVCTKKSYQLVAISSHMGSSGVGGHYIAYCRNPFQREDDDIWYVFNDSSVRKVKFEDKNCHSPYFLIFRRTV